MTGRDRHELVRRCRHKLRVLRSQPKAQRDRALAGKLIEALWLHEHGCNDEALLQKLERAAQ